MAAALHHRGPDDKGVWSDPARGIALAHSRLSILDLTAAGHQPMLSASGRYTIVFNGEIYNHSELRELLDHSAHAPAWRGHSDTEVLCAAIEAWGFEACLAKTVGMFAIALWDREAGQLHLARDRVGEKPLYYGLSRGRLVFASELKALRAVEGFQRDVDRGALALMLRLGYVPAPLSIYREIRKLPPGCWLSIGSEEIVRGSLPSPVAYWSTREVVERCQRQGFAGDAIEAATELERLLRNAIASQMVADVPLGAFLSGGIDSSTIVALMQVQSARPIQTFTIGFHEEGYDEAASARAIASHLGTAHTELYVTPREAMAVIPDLPRLYDEPFGDSSQIPTFLVAQLARRSVTVSLSGDGGDELFGGYNRYFWASRIWQRIHWMPAPVRRAFARSLTRLSPARWNTAFHAVDRLLPASWRYANPGDKVHKLAEILGVGSPEELYRGLVSLWRHPAALVVDGSEPRTVLDDPSRWADLAEFEHRMMYLDLLTYLPDDILVKIDRAAMGVSLETRVPLLDHRVIEFAWRLPLSLKIRDGRGKWPLREILQRHVPAALVDRPKMGFGVPIDAWLRGPLRPWADDLLAADRLRREGFLDPEPVQAKWREHLSGGRNWSYHLWNVLMFQAWLQSA